MVYNFKKVKREWRRQQVLQKSWDHIYYGILELEKRGEYKPSTFSESYILEWCRKENCLLKKINKDFHINKAQKALKLLVNRILSKKDPLMYNIQQLKLQALRYQ